jgi:hypothetical protein
VVIFDRIRENQSLMKELPLARLMDVSISQTFGRTIMTSFTTLIAIVPMAIIGTGAVQIFSICMIIGIFFGSYSTIYIASPIVLAWQNALNKRKAKKESRLTGHAPVAHIVKPVERVVEQGQPAPAEETPAQPAAEETHLEQGVPTTSVRIQHTIKKKKRR